VPDEVDDSCPKDPASQTPRITRHRTELFGFLVVARSASFAASLYNKSLFNKTAADRTCYFSGSMPEAALI
jgi:hypothetical protein